MFASRCMSVKTVPVQHAEVDYAELCAALQAKVIITTILFIADQSLYVENINCRGAVLNVF